MASPKINDMFDLGFYATMHDQGFTVKQAHVLYKYACAFETYDQMEKTAALSYFPENPETSMFKSAAPEVTWNDMMNDAANVLLKEAGYFDNVNFGDSPEAIEARKAYQRQYDAGNVGWTLPNLRRNVREIGKGLYNMGGDALNAAGDSIVSGGEWVGDKARQGADWANEHMIQPVVNAGRAVADDVRTRTAGEDNPLLKPLTYGASYARDAYDAVAPTVERGAEWLGDKARRGAEWVGDKANQAAEWAGNVAHKGLDAIGAGARWAYDKGRQAANWIGDKAKGIWGAITGGVKRIGDSLAKGWHRKDTEAAQAAAPKATPAPAPAAAPAPTTPSGQQPLIQAPAAGPTPQLTLGANPDLLNKGASALAGLANSLLYA